MGWQPLGTGFSAGRSRRRCEDAFPLMTVFLNAYSAELSVSMVKWPFSAIVALCRQKPAPLADYPFAA
jgi:hypothetical protein